MNYRKLIVTDDNKLNLENFNLKPDNAEILDINKSLKDVCQDTKLQSFIKTTAVSPSKIYFICLKEDFGSYEQRIENIINLNQYYKQLKKIFKAENIFFFVYNTYMKNEVSINPTLNTPSALNLQPSSSTNVSDTNVTEPKSKLNSLFSFGNKGKQKYQNDENINNVEEVAENSEVILKNEISDEDLANEIDNFSSGWSKNKNAKSLSNYANDYKQSNLEDPNISNPAAPASYDDLFTFNPEDEKVRRPYDNLNEDIDSIITTEEGLEVPTQPLEDVIEERDSRNSLNNEWSKLDTTFTEVSNNDTTGMQYKEKTDSSQSSYNTLGLDSDMVDIPESFYDSDDSDINLLNDESSDYLDFKNDYELNVHALKSIYDFIWRMLILNNYNLKLNDLLYLTVNNLGAFSIGQSDFVRQISNKSDSLFDLILQLDIKLEFNNSLFYIYLAELFSIKANKIVINTAFLNTLAIWVNRGSKQKFIEQVEQFVNYSTIYNKKIIFSHFVELSNFIKGCLLSIKPTMPIVDIHRIIFNKYKKIRNENIFGFMLERICDIFDKVGINIESEIFETPDKMFDGSAEFLDDSSWKEKLISLYTRLLMNIKNYILSKGNKELEIFNIYIDIKDLKMYFNENAKDLLILKNEYKHSSATNDKYLTIGDAFDRSISGVPATSYKESLAIDQEKFFKKLEAESKSREEDTAPYVYDFDTNVEEDELMHETRFNDESDSLNEIDDSDDSDDYGKFFKSDIDEIGLSENAPSYEQNVMPQQEVINQVMHNENLSADTKFKFVNNGLEDMMSRKIDEYEKKIKENIERIEIERKQLRLKMEELKNL